MNAIPEFVHHFLIHLYFKQWLFLLSDHSFKWQHFISETQCYTHSFASNSGCPTHSMDISIDFRWDLKIYHCLNISNIQSSGCQISSQQIVKFTILWCYFNNNTLKSLNAYNLYYYDRFPCNSQACNSWNPNNIANLWHCNLVLANIIVLF